MKMFNCTCTECGGDFEAKTMLKKVCGPVCAMRKWRRTEKGKKSLLKQAKKAKKRSRKQVCECCKTVFMTARKARYLCDKCIPEHSIDYTQARFRKNNRWSKKGGKRTGNI